MKTLLPSSNPQKALFFLIKNPAKEYLETEIQKRTRLSKAGVNLALRRLRRSGWINREKRGKSFFYSVDAQHPLIKQLKVVQNLMLLKNFIKRISKNTEEIILFGSAARGENDEESDIDLMIITNSPQGFEKTKFNKKIKPIIKTPLQFSELKPKDPIFWEEVGRGLSLFKK